MCPIEPKAGLGIVIEGPELPVGGMVTVGTFGAEAAAVDVVRCMTGHAFAARILERARRMAVVALNDAVRPDERKAGEIMIEEDVSAPPAFIVTRVTGGALLSLVDIGSSVAGITGRLHLRVLKLSSVALVAANRAMLAA